MIYLDHNASTQVLPDVLKAYTQASKHFANPSSLHALGRHAKEALEASRETVCDVLSAQRHQLIFTSSATEANNQVLWSVAQKGFQSKVSPHIITSDIEHSSIYNTCKFLETCGVEVTYVGCDSDGVVSIQEIKDAINENTALISIMMVNNEVGSQQPIQEIIDIAKHHNIPVHTDAVQAIGKMAVDVSKLDIDYLTLSGHKIHAPKGIGALFVKDDETLLPFIRGGGHERGLRSGTEHVAGAAALAKAMQQLDHKAFKDHCHPIKEQFITALQALEGATILNLNHSVSNTLSVSFDGHDAMALAMKLDLGGVCVSTGSACSTGSVDPSRVLLAMGIPEDTCKSALRFSWGDSFQLKDIDTVIDVLKS